MKDNSRGFASAEMLIGMLIVIGVLAAVGLQSFGVFRERAQVTVLVVDLRHLAASEEAYYADHSTYYGGEIPSSALAFVPSAGVTMTIDAAGEAGWSATAAKSGSSWKCRGSYGVAVPAVPATAETQADCTR